MAVRAVACFFALVVFATFQVKKFAFCSSDSFNLYLNNTGDNLVIKESFICSSIWINRQEKHFQVRPTRNKSIVMVQILILLCGDIETCPGPATKCGSCMKTVRKNQSRICCAGCKLLHHLKCIDNETEALCRSCLSKSFEVEDHTVEPTTDNQQQYELPELTELLARKGLKILHQNIRGLLAHKQNICHILGDFKGIHILSLSETHLAADEEAECQILGYDFLGKPRTSGQGGGTGIYISQSVPFQRRLDLEDNDIECIWIEILFPKSKGFLIGVIYRPPDSSKHLPENFNETFESMLSTVVSEDKECILTGDINCNYLESSDHKELKAILSLFNLKSNRSQ
eukprot:Seg346.1 transcript_id=Seg346.1/GoldUCD/mRNA.D3Y31 product="hypothetical protein" protein_id=Seg346.1/GoldUCD/D3Y31